MNLQRIFAPSMREAIQIAKETFGQDIIIVSNRQHKDKIELIVAKELDASQAHDITTFEANRPKTEKKSSIEWLHDPAIEGMQNELKILRGLLQEQLTGLAWHEFNRKDPIHSSIIRRLSFLGFSPNFSEKALLGVEEREALELAWNQTIVNIRNSIPLLKHQEIKDQEKQTVIACIGSTGVGKSTAIAQIAAQTVLKYGRESVGLMTLDVNRVGGVESLEIYSRIFNIPFRVIRNYQDFLTSMKLYEHKPLILIDTTGVNQENAVFSYQNKILSDRNFSIKKYWVLAATHQLKILEQQSAFFLKNKVDAAIITKLDESSSIGECLSIIYDNNVPIAYVADGGKVPDNFHFPDPDRLIFQAIFSKNPNDTDLKDENAVKESLLAGYFSEKVLNSHG